MRLHAISIGRHAARGRFSGVVHSVFPRAANLRIGGEGLLTLLSPCSGNVPHGARLATPEGFSFTDHLAAGQAAGCRAGILRVVDGEISVDLGGARLWQGDAPAPPVDLRWPAAAAAWRAAWHGLWRRREGRGATPSPSVLPDALDLAQATRDLRSARAAVAIGRLIGRGPGLTPAGDDLMVGFLGGLWSALGGNAARSAFARSLGAAVERAAPATNEISQSYLRHALAGSLAEPLAELRRAIGQGLPEARIERAMAKALEVGHTSGEDGVLGLLLGLAAWAPEVLGALSAAPRSG